ncbi:MAG: hypothetical protein HY646_02340 [Acidobacteria bacterium]|nr:hypothetical protein [Acidobacteriota bacterium]
MKGLISFIGAMLMTFLPPRYRDATGLRAAALSCGIAQVWISTLFLVYRYVQFMRLNEERIGRRAELVFDAFGGAAIYQTGVFVMFEFALQPLHAWLIYMVVEGAVRSMAALVGEQVIGHVPLYAISGLHTLRDKIAHKRELGALVVDQVVHGTPKSNYDLKVYSCRPKLHWNPYVTIEFEDEFYQLFREEPGSPPRRFVYYLRKNPVGRVVTKIHHYKIDDVLKK